MFAILLKLVSKIARLKVGPTAYMAKSGNFEVADSRISKIAASPMANSTESKGGNSTFKNGILGRLSGSFSTEAHNRSSKSPNICLAADKWR